MRHSFHRVMMRSHARLSYGEAQAAIEGHPDEKAAPLLDRAIRPLFAAYRALAKARDAREPLALDIPERKLLLNPDGTLAMVVVPVADAHRLIEEFMILANVAAAETCEQLRVPLIYRVHDQPALDKVSALRDFLATLDIKLAKSDQLRPATSTRCLHA
jgi:ribonuclease R